ncbi:hypothetical protein [uncultured Tateyamaria sp.]|uniref:hypothetical protein n=1 Tax=uncultured Tateyamaria sp. TaxID=455651 RepID=UPI00261C560D|nr:hypothetical protein [uncultured Tateyamaria sp.]
MGETIGKMWQAVNGTRRDGRADPDIGAASGCGHGTARWNRLADRQVMVVSR